MLADRCTTAIVRVEQYDDFAAELADQYLEMERGEVVQRGAGRDIEADGVRQRMSIRRDRRPRPRPFARRARASTPQSALPPGAPR